MKKIRPAIVAIGYNREKSLERLLDSISRAYYPEENITLIISIDFWKENNPCYKVAEEFAWNYGEKKIIMQENNLGLREHVLRCGDYSQNYGAVILLEDDVVVSPAYYSFAMAACDFYDDKEDAIGIGLLSLPYNGYAQLPFYPLKNGYDTYYWKGTISWGECFCARQWKKFREWLDSIQMKLPLLDSIPSDITKWPDSSWTKYLDYYMENTGGYFVVPYESYTTNYSDVGKHVKKKSAVWQTNMQYGGKDEYNFSDRENAVKYNFFFENEAVELIKKEIGIKGTLLVDLYGRCKGIDNYDFCISTRILGYEIVRAFALEMRPIELNVLNNIEGSGIFLYNTKRKRKIKIFERTLQVYNVYRYYYPLLQYKLTLKYMIFETYWKIKTKYFRK